MKPRYTVLRAFLDKVNDFSFLILRGLRMKTALATPDGETFRKISIHCSFLSSEQVASIKAKPSDDGAPVESG
jgi:hypothetical protein